MSMNYLQELNAEQRQAVEYGIKDGNANNIGPLLLLRR